MIDAANNRMITRVAMPTAKTKNGNMFGTQSVMNAVQQQFRKLSHDLIDASSARMETFVIADVYFNVQPKYLCTVTCVVDAQNEHSMYGQVLFAASVFEVV